MRIINFTLLAVLSCIAMIGAMPIKDGALAGSIARRKSLSEIQVTSGGCGSTGRSILVVQAEDPRICDRDYSTVM
ncbi:hypothetical protein V8E52_011645 [Russula decolorans]